MLLINLISYRLLITDVFIFRLSTVGTAVDANYHALGLRCNLKKCKLGQEITNGARAASRFATSEGEVTAYNAKHRDHKRREDLIDLQIPCHNLAHPGIKLCPPDSSGCKVRGLNHCATTISLWFRIILNKVPSYMT